MELKALGFDPIKISLDDYYLTDSFIPLDEDGKRDYEVLEALNLELFKEQIDSLLKGEEVHLASFSFKKKETTFREESVKLKENSIVVIEGIHGLNPKLFEGYDEHLSYKIYISALTQLNLDSRSRISTTDNRILRRIVRDSRTRGTSVTETLKMWPSVERGEKNHIFPYQNNADAMINSALEYELGVIKQMGYVDYFLIVWDFIKYANDNGIPTGPGRGSAAGALVAYTLGITKIDPMKYSLLFERKLRCAV